MAKKEVSVEEKLRALYELQVIDSTIDKIRTIRGELPLEVQDLEDEVEGLQKRLENLTTEIDNLKIELSNKKNSITDSNNLIKKYEEVVGYLKLVLVMMDFKQLKLVFNIGQIEYKTSKSLPKEIQLSYLTKFKKEFTIDEFDEFIGLGDPYTHGTDKTTISRKSIMDIYGIDIPNGILSYTKELVRERREKNIEFNRELKLKMIL